MYPTDIHKTSLGKGMADDSLQRVKEFADNGTELLFVWGRQVRRRRHGVTRKRL